ncbi:potassium voltage-gated channel protein shaw [Plakobranchus ocellatus]|uniref:Potassium voltage-gated channel protein shaw n=1 Tax=Plakobranchus ocellatus TaxID=259542 RepID=A0AAV4CZC9_9GAST|nr:potassium voltage-gated channel protein shaw [Plakobranchus ocellatus]
MSHAQRADHKDTSDVNANDQLKPLLDKGDYSLSAYPLSTEHTSQQTLRAVDSRVYFNVGGIVFQTLETTVKQSRNKRFKLADPTFLSKYYDERRGEYFFDRDPEVFRSILNYWRTGHLHLPASMCGPQLKEELDFWGLREVDIEPCCWNSFNQWMQTVTSLKQLEIDRNPSYMRPQEVITEGGPCHVMRVRLWKLLTDPSDSRAAKIYAYVALVFVLMAIFSFCASTHQLFDVSSQSDNNETDTKENKESNAQTPTTSFNATGAAGIPYQTTTLRSTTTTLPAQWRDTFSSRIHPSLFYIDIICLVFFSVEYLVKFVCASPRCQFVTSLTAVFDVLAILPDYIEIMLFIFFPSLLMSGNTGIIDFMPFLRLMRAFRIFRLIRRVPGLWIMMYTLRASFKELSLMLVFLLVGTLLFASIIFFVDDPKVFTSIPHGFWWAIVTMTTVGYGDMAPVTAWGQIVGSVTAICGVLIVGFTIPSLVNNFITYYNHIEFVVQKEKLLKVLAEEEERDKEEDLLRASWPESYTGKPDRLNGNRDMKGDKSAPSAAGCSSSGPGDGNMAGRFRRERDEERGEGHDDGEDARLVAHHGIPLESIKLSLSRQRINFAD